MKSQKICVLILDKVSQVSNTVFLFTVFILTNTVPTTY